MYLFIFRERKGERKRGRETLMCERNIDQLPLVCALTGDQACNTGMCPDWESNRRRLALQDDTQPTELHQPGQQSVAFAEQKFLNFHEFQFNNFFYGLHFWYHI